MATPSDTIEFSGILQPPLSLVSIFPSDEGYNSWITYRLNGFLAPGSIPRGGMKGFKRTTIWDVRKGKGVAGATLTRTNRPPMEGTIVSQLTTSQDFSNWEAFVFNVLYVPDNIKDPPGPQGLKIQHPQLNFIGLNTVVVKHFTGPEHQGKGLYTATVEFIEWFPPPPKSITSTVVQAAPDAPAPGPRVDSPRNTQLKTEIALQGQSSTP